MRYTIVAIFIAFSVICRAQILGCTDHLASNHNSSATVNDDSCTYGKSSLSAEISYDLSKIMLETSGLIFFDNKLWTQNENAAINLYSFAFSESPQYETWELTGTSNIDQEEIWKNIQISPNPFVDKVNIISSQSQIEKIYITDFNGRLIMEINSDYSNSLILDFSELKSGIYIINIHTEKNLLKYKLIKS